MNKEEIKNSDYMNTNKVKSQRNAAPSIVFAILLILFGATALVTRNYGWSQMQSVILSWAMLAVVVGIAFLSNQHLFSGLAFLGTGAFFILPKLANVFPQIVLPDNFINDYWGVLVIYIGVLLLLGITIKHKGGFNHTHNFAYYRGRRRVERHKRNGLAYLEAMRQQCEGDKNHNRHWFSHSVAFGDDEYIFLEPMFNGGDINVAFGESKLDLRKTDIAEGVTDLHIKVVFGNCVVIIPQNWVISTEESKIFGGKVTDKRIFFDTNSGQQDIKTLNIAGSVACGNLELRN
jgi:predicted membrane protein